MATNPRHPLPDQAAFKRKGAESGSDGDSPQQIKRKEADSRSDGEDNSHTIKRKKIGKSVLFPPLSPSNESSRDTIGTHTESFVVMFKGGGSFPYRVNKSFNLSETIHFVLQFFTTNRLVENESDTSDKYNTLVTKRIADLTHLAVLYYSGCKQSIPELTYLDFAVAFLIYYLITKPGTFDNTDIINIYKNKPGSREVGAIIEGGADLDRVNLCTLCLTSFDVLAVPTTVPTTVPTPDRLTTKLLAILGGKRKTRRNNRTSKNKKSKKNRKNSKSKRRRSRRLISR